MRPAGLALCFLVALGTVDVGAADAPLPQPAPRWPVLEELHGKVVLLDFWASWCSPCLRSFPWMNDLQQKHAGEGLVVVAVNLDQDRALADGFLEKVPALFRVEYDGTGDLARQFGVKAMPTSFLIDRAGKVRARHAGFREKQRDEREQLIEQLLKEHAT